LLDSLAGVSRWIRSPILSLFLLLILSAILSLFLLLILSLILSLILTLSLSLILLPIFFLDSLSAHWILLPDSLAEVSHWIPLLILSLYLSLILLPILLVILSVILSVILRHDSLAGLTRWIACWIHPLILSSIRSLNSLTRFPCRFFH